MMISSLCLILCFDFNFEWHNGSKWFPCRRFLNVCRLVISQRYCCCVALGRLLIFVCSLVISHLHSWFEVYGIFLKSCTSTWNGPDTASLMPRYLMRGRQRLFEKKIKVLHWSLPLCAAGAQGQRWVSLSTQLLDSQRSPIKNLINRGWSWQHEVNGCGFLGHREG